MNICTKCCANASGRAWNISLNNWKMKSHHASSSGEHEYTKPTHLSSPPSSHTASLASTNWLFNNEPNIQQSLRYKERVKLLVKRSERRAAAAEPARQLRWSQAWNLSVTWTCHGCTNEQVWRSNSNFDFSYNSHTDTCQGLLTPCNHFHLSFPEIHMDIKSRAWQIIQQFVD